MKYSRSKYNGHYKYEPKYNDKFQNIFDKRRNGKHGND